MRDTEILEFIVDGDRITYPPEKSWLESWYGIWLSIALPKFTAAGWQIMAKRPLVGVNKTSTFYVLQRSLDGSSQKS
ncbi:MAG: hypothetical protein H0X24_14055 [Ktedonobacterales bacterium]|nr:hypothetical protein [Ktedonobacterales bacterium]